MSTTNPAPLFPVDDSPSVVMKPASTQDFQSSTARRGRPRTKVQPLDVTAPFRNLGGQSGTSPPAPPPPGSPGTPPGSEAQREKERVARQAAKDREIRELTNKIVKEFNEQLMEGLITLGIPEGFLYKNPSARPLAVDSKYTAIGQAICVNPMQANWIAHGIQEAKEFPAIQKLTIGGSKEGPSYLWLALGGLGLLSYLQGLFTAVTQMQKLMKELKAIQEMQSTEDLRGPVGMNFQENSAEEFQG